MNRKALQFTAIVTAGVLGATLARAQVVAPPAPPVQIPSTMIGPQQTVPRIRLQATPAVPSAPIPKAPAAAATATSPRGSNPLH